MPAPDLQTTLRLAFFDSLYMCDGPRLHSMTEDIPVNPCSKKGQLRTEAAAMKPLGPSHRAENRVTLSIAVWM